MAAVAGKGAMRSVEDEQALSKPFHEASLTRQETVQEFARAEAAVDGRLSYVRERPLQGTVPSAALQANGRL
ncbi:hypothetical protein AS156_39875 [Bradyrhizobium macuxiense]|uniref:Uncharacterized protein n=1 Tax=Bradyrhizobium macuxiense TaxID=1755647 RepID=A0A109JYH8_9BRAD|nr:hypothetical protein AS156_39875 [Bradyrhizobium macuxiense]